MFRNGKFVGPVSEEIGTMSASRCWRVRPVWPVLCTSHISSEGGGRSFKIEICRTMTRKRKSSDSPAFSGSELMGSAPIFPVARENKRKRRMQNHGGGKKSNWKSVRRIFELWLFPHWTGSGSCARTGRCIVSPWKTYYAWGGWVKDGERERGT